jgi:hypothetical protein
MGKWSTSLVMKKCKSKWHWDFISVRMAIINNTQKQMLLRMWRKRNTCRLWVGI